MRAARPKPYARRDDRIATWVLGVSLLLIAAFFALTMWHVPYVVERPGPIVDTLGKAGSQQIVEVKGEKSYTDDGHLYFTTVSVLGGPERHISAWEWLQAKVDGDAVIVPEEQVFPKGATDAEVKEANVAAMEGSQQTAVAAGLRSVGQKVGQRNLVASIVDQSPADGKVELKDEIRAVDGKSVNRVIDIVTAISDRSPGDPVKLTVKRGNAERTLTLTTTDIGGGRAGIGIGIEPVFDFPVEVRIHAGEVGGPSAGMMFGLATRDRLTPGSLTGGRSVAGTGTIDDSGWVGPIGGIRQKMVGAREGGAEYFLAPKGNCDEVVGHIPKGLTVVEVTDFDTAVRSVERIAKGDAVGLPDCSTAAPKG